MFNCFPYSTHVIVLQIVGVHSTSLTGEQLQTCGIHCMGKTVDDLIHILVHSTS